MVIAVQGPVGWLPMEFTVSDPVGPVGKGVADEAGDADEDDGPDEAGDPDEAEDPELVEDPEEVMTPTDEVEVRTS